MHCHPLCHRRDTACLMTQAVKYREGLEIALLAIGSFNSLNAMEKHH